MADDRLGIEDGVNIGYAFLQRDFQFQLAESITVRATRSSGPFVASAGRNGITVNTANSNWRITSDAFRRKVMVHELFHVLQFHNSWARSLGWLLEGSAEFVGFRGALVDTGLISSSEAHECNLAGLFSSSPPLGPLQAIDLGSGQNHYTLFYLAVERLLEGRSINLLARFTTFEGSFGISLSDFYGDFEQYRSTLRPPFGPACLGFGR